jgi:hypothetical protein
MMVAGLAALACMSAATQAQDWLSWYRPVDQPVFTTQHGNNHDAIFFYEPESVYKYKLIISNEASGGDFWRAKNWSIDSADWELVNDDYDIAGKYEYDDGVKVNGKYYIYEGGRVYTTTSGLDPADGNWNNEGSWSGLGLDDVGVHYEDGWFHLFGEYNGVHGSVIPNDGSTIAHYKSQTGLGNWQLVSHTAADPNAGLTTPQYGVGDATIAKIGNEYWMYLDREEAGVPYRITAWKSDSLDNDFQYVGIAAAPRSGETDDWDNHRVQDAEVEFIPELNRYVMFANMMDIDGDPGYEPGFNYGNTILSSPQTRVVGIFYSQEAVPEPASVASGFVGLTLIALRRRRGH